MKVQDSSRKNSLTSAPDFALNQVRCFFNVKALENIKGRVQIIILLQDIDDKLKNMWISG